MQATIRLEGKRAVIRLSGRFEFSVHREFREITDQALQYKDVDEIVIDMADVEYLDSSALGMLLQLREKAKPADKRIILASLRGVVKQVVDIANFEKLFSIIG